MLNELKQLQTPITLSIIGMGAMGKGLLYQVEITPGFCCNAISDIDIDKAIAFAQWLKREYRVVDSVAAAMDAIRSGVLAIAADGHIVADCDEIDVLIESTNTIMAAGKFCKHAIDRGKHVIMMNAEADLAFGPYLMQKAKDNGVVY